MTEPENDPLRSYSAFAFQEVVELLGDILGSLFDGLFVVESPALNRVYLLLVRKAKALAFYLDGTESTLQQFLDVFPNLYEAIGDPDSPDENWEFGGQNLLKRLKARAADAYVEYVSVASREKLDADDEALLTTARDLLRSYQEDKARRTKRWEKAFTEQAEQLKSRIPTTGPGAEPAERPRGSPKAESGHANRRTVFVVHGRDEQARKAVFQFLRSIGLKPLEWSQAVAATGKATPYVGEVLDSAFSLAQAVVVVLTGDDEARLRPELRDPSEPSHEINLTPQARPNVLFEAGMAMARSMDRTVLIELGKLRPFSDIGGRFTVRLDNSTQRRQDFAARLQAAKCEVDLTGTDWHSAGDFEASGV